MRLDSKGLSLYEDPGPRTEDAMTLKHLRLFCAIVLLSLAAGCDGDSDSSVPGDFSQAENDDRVGERIVRCAVPEVDQGRVDMVDSMFRTARALGRTERGTATVSVPTVIHVISSDGTEAGGNLSDAALIQQINFLNVAYAGGFGGAPTPFQFRVTGITRSVNPVWAQMTLGSFAEAEAKNALHQGGANTLNLYFANPPDGTLGWATFPWDFASAPSLDGVVVLFRTVPGGNLPPYNEGDTLVHEVGHWLGLFHTFQGTCGAVNDTIADTPPEARPAYGCPVGRNTCSRNDAADAINNYMNYSDDSCLFEFSSEQAARVDILAQQTRGL